MKKTSKTRTRKSRTASKPKAVPVGVPTIGQRLQMTRRALTMIAAGLGVDYDELHRIKPEVEAVSLTRGDVTMHDAGRAAVSFRRSRLLALPLAG